MSANHASDRMSDQPPVDLHPTSPVRPEVLDSQSRFLSGSPAELQAAEIEIESGVKLADRFTVVRLLGRGCLSTVYLAHDDHRGQEVAIKQVDAGPRGESAAAQLLQREAELNARVIDYRHVIRVHDLRWANWEGVRLLLMSMQYGEGGTFRNWFFLQDEYNDDCRSAGLRCFSQICTGVTALHDAGVIHSDVRPENCVFAGGVIKLIDFGQAKCFRPDPPVDPTGRNAIHRDYRSPEATLGTRGVLCDPRSDIFSLGVILFELIEPTQPMPWTGRHSHLIDAQAVMSISPWFQAHPETAAIVARCLQLTPTDRYNSVWELLDDLKGAVGDSASIVGPGAPCCQGRTPPRLEGVWKEALLCLAKGRYTEAAGYCRQVLEIRPGHPSAGTILEKLQARYLQAEELYKAVDRNLDNGDLRELASLVRDAISIYPDHPSGRTVQTRLGARASRYREFLQNGLTALQQSRFTAAIVSFQQASKLNPADPYLTYLVETVGRFSRRRRE